MEEIRLRTGPYQITAGHYGDLQAAAASCEDSAEILKDLQADPGIEVVQNPEPGHYYADLSVSFMYPSGYKRQKEERLKAEQTAAQ